jgi:GTP-binding protein
LPKTSRFVDEAKIFVKAGDGGNGHIGFHRAKFVPKGGPNGGDGGRGGDVAAVGSEHLLTLLDFKFHRHFRAQNGEAGGRDQCTGADGNSLEIAVPLGTVLSDTETGDLIGEITQANQHLVIEGGGRGGLGNMHFATSTNRAPRKATPGVERKGRWIRLELRILADVGIVGPPNAGKSTLLTALTPARPKIAAYPFTTLSPVLGTAEFNGRRIVLADIPGLIEDANAGVGLGTQFLRHIQRTRALIYVVAADEENPSHPWNDYQTTRREIDLHGAELVQKPSLVVLNKIDLLTDAAIRANLENLRKHGIDAIAISAKTGLALKEFQTALGRLLSNLT